MEQSSASNQKSYIFFLYFCPLPSVKVQEQSCVFTNGDKIFGYIFKKVQCFSSPLDFAWKHLHRNESHFIENLSCMGNLISVNMMFLKRSFSPNKTLICIQLISHSMDHWITLQTLHNAIPQINLEKFFSNEIKDYKSSGLPIFFLFTFHISSLLEHTS